MVTVSPKVKNKLRHFINYTHTQLEPHPNMHMFTFHCQVIAKELEIYAQQQAEICFFFL